MHLCLQSCAGLGGDGDPVLAAAAFDVQHPVRAYGATGDGRLLHLSLGHAKTFQNCQAGYLFFCLTRPLEAPDRFDAQQRAGARPWRHERLLHLSLGCAKTFQKCQAGSVSTQFYSEPDHVPLTRLKEAGISIQFLVDSVAGCGMPCACESGQRQRLRRACRSHSSVIAAIQSESNRRTWTSGLLQVRRAVRMRVGPASTLAAGVTLTALQRHVVAASTAWVSVFDVSQPAVGPQHLFEDTLPVIMAGIRLKVNPSQNGIARVSSRVTRSLQPSAAVSGGGQHSLGQHI